jgi:protein-disulfide isomerase
VNHLSIPTSLRIAALAGFAVLIAVLLLFSGQPASSEATGDPTSTPPPTATPEEEEYRFKSVAELMDFLADDDPYLGPDDAPVVIVEFSDYACPYCGKFFLDTLPLILDAYPDEVKYVHRDYPIFGDVSVKLAISVDCALEQDKFWEMHQAYLEHFSDFDPESEHHGPPQQGGSGHDDRFDYYTDEQILELAKNAGVADLDQFSTCVSEAQYEDEVYGDYQIGAAIGIQGVPFFVINAQAVSGAQSFDVFQQVIEQSLEDLG